MTWRDLRAEIAELFDQGDRYEDSLIGWLAHRAQVSEARLSARDRRGVDGYYRANAEEIKARKRARYVPSPRQPAKGQSPEARARRRARNAARYAARREEICKAKRERYKRKKASNGSK